MATAKTTALKLDVMLNATGPGDTFATLVNGTLTKVEVNAQPGMTVIGESPNELEFPLSLISLPTLFRGHCRMHLIRRHARPAWRAGQNNGKLMNSSSIGVINLMIPTLRSDRFLRNPGGGQHALCDHDDVVSWSRVKHFDKWEYIFSTPHQVLPRRHNFDDRGKNPLVKQPDPDAHQSWQGWLAASFSHFNT
jgi:hypothetical protein